jgi:hypothetical protein
VNAEKLAETAQGRKYGCFLKNSEFPKVSGKRSVGRDNDPPIIGLQTMVGIADRSKGRLTYPSAPPTDNVIGMYAKTCGAFVGSVISAIILLMIPTLPLRTPFRPRLECHERWMR